MGDTMKIMAKKLFIYLGGLFILAVGVNISKAAQLGISPVSAIPYACELIWGIELGKATTIVYVIIMALQIIILRKNYKARQLLQIVCTYILSVFITYTGYNYLLFWMPEPGSYLIKILYLLISIIFIGVGVSFYLIPNFIQLPADGLVAAIVQASHNKLEFGSVKIIVDSSLVSVSALLSLIFLGHLKSVREGTVLASLLVGRVVSYVLKRYRNKILCWVEK
jgi:uncharacterized membrane protein YczE